MDGAPAYFSFDSGTMWDHPASWWLEKEGELTGRGLMIRLLGWVEGLCFFLHEEEGEEVWRK